MKHSPAARVLARPYRLALLTSVLLPIGASFAAAQDAVPASGTPETAPATSPARSASTSAVSVLIEQARYWREHDKRSQALESLSRALRIEPANAEALALQAEIEAESGNKSAAQAALAKLRQAHPGDARLAGAESAVQAGQVSQPGLAEARQLAREGRTADAVAAYQRAFNGTTPPDNLAAEYYQTLAGTEGGWQAAHGGLAADVTRNPQDTAAQLAYAKLLSYREATRAEGIERLAVLTKSPAVGTQAEEAWRAALQWLPANAASAPLLRTYLDAHPNDAGIQQRLTLALSPPTAADPAAQDRSNGFAALNSGHLAEAERLFQAALSRHPDDPDALGGLGLVRLRQGRAAEAREVLKRAIQVDPGHRSRWASALNGASTAPQNTAAHSRATTLSDDAKHADNLETRAALYRAAVQADPSDPWLRLDLARALAKLGDAAGARQTMQAVTQTPNASRDALRAGAVYASEANDPGMAAALIGRLPKQDRSPEMRALQARAALQQDIDQALASPDRASMRERLLTLAATSDPDGSRGAMIAGALAKAGDPAGARQAIATAKAANRNPPPAARLAYAGALLQAGASAEAAALIAGLDRTGGLTSEQSASLDSLRAGLAVQSSDRLNEAGRQAEAYDHLAPALTRTPDSPDLNLALARLYQSADQPAKALAIDTALLQRDPGNVQVRQAAVAAAIKTGNLAQADTLVQEGVQTTPNAPEIWMAAADLARARGDDQRALHDLQRARDLRRQQTAPAAAADTYLVATSISPPPANPFRKAAMAGLEDPDAGRESVPSILQGNMPPAAAPPADAMAASIDRQIAGLQEQLAPSFQAGVNLRGRSGSNGLDRLTEAAVPMVATFSPGVGGKVTVEARPTSLSAGTLDASSPARQQFGTLALGGPAPGAQTALGVGLDAKYATKWIAADVGSTPLGFRVQNVVGGAEVAPELAPGLRLRATAERRAITDSLLSYAGTKDPRTGVTFGGVTTTRGHAQLELAAGLATLYAGGGYASLTGQNVVRNNEVEFGAGGSIPVYRTPEDEVRVGLDLTYFAYDKNLRFFSLGQGGYFSPQSYVAALVPVSYQHKGGDLDWSVGAAVGYQTYRENASDVFPGNAGLQAQLVSLASGTPGIATSYAGTSQAGLTGNAHAAVEYRISPNLKLGGKLAYDRAGSWNEASGTVFARYVFSGAQ